MRWFEVDVESVVRFAVLAEDEADARQAVADGDGRVVETVSGPDVVAVRDVGPS